MKIILSTFFVLTCLNTQIAPETAKLDPIEFAYLEYSLPPVACKHLDKFVFDRKQFFKYRCKIPFKAEAFIKEEVKKFIAEFDRRMDFDILLEKLGQKIEEDRGKLGADHEIAEKFMEFLLFVKTLPDLGKNLKKFSAEDFKGLVNLSFFRNFNHLIRIYQDLSLICSNYQLMPKNDFIIAMINLYSNKIVDSLRIFNLTVLRLPCVANEPELKEKRKSQIQEFIDYYRTFMINANCILNEKKVLRRFESEFPRDIFDLIKSVALCQYAFNVFRYFVSGFRSKEYSIIFKKQLIEDSLCFISVLSTSYDDFVHETKANSSKTAKTEAPEEIIENNAESYGSQITYSEVITL